MALEEVLKEKDGWHERVFLTPFTDKAVLLDNKVADLVVRILIEKKMYDHITIISGKEETGKPKKLKAIQGEIYEALIPAWGHEFDIVETVALVLKDLEHITAKEIKGLETSMASPYEKARASCVLYVANGENDLAKFRNPRLFSIHLQLITNENVIPLYTEKQIANEAKRLLKRRLKPKYFKLGPDSDKPNEFNNYYTQLNTLISHLFMSGPMYNAPLEETWEKYSKAGIVMDTATWGRFYHLLHEELKPLRDDPLALERAINDLNRQYQENSTRKNKNDAYNDLVVARFYNILNSLLEAIKTSDLSDPLIGIVEGQLERLNNTYKLKLKEALDYVKGHRGEGYWTAKPVHGRIGWPDVLPGVPGKRQLPTK